MARMSTAKSPTVLDSYLAGRRHPLGWAAAELLYLLAAAWGVLAAPPMPEETQERWLAVGFLGYVLVLWGRFHSQRRRIAGTSRPIFPLLGTLAPACLWAAVVVAPALVLTPMWFPSLLMMAVILLVAVIRVRGMDNRGKLFDVKFQALSDARRYRCLRGLATAQGLPQVEIMQLGDQDYRVAVAFCEARADVPRIHLSLSLLDLLDDRELAGVFAHELAHLRAGDNGTAVWRYRFVLGLAVACGYAAAIGMGGDNPSLVAPAFFALVCRTIYTLGTIPLAAASRRAEVRANQGALEMTGDPQALRSALLKMAAHNGLPTGAGWLARVFWMQPGLGQMLDLIARWSCEHPDAQPVAPPPEDMGEAPPLTQTPGSNYPPLASQGD